MKRKHKLDTIKYQYVKASKLPPAAEQVVQEVPQKRPVQQQPEPLPK